MALSVLMLSASISSQAASGDSDGVSELDSGPDLELLEFLGQWETDAGEWVDPDLLGDSNFAQIIDAASIVPGTGPAIGAAPETTDGPPTND